jgi:flagellar biosynthesis/type III secretory pathway chaperone
MVFTENLKKKSDSLMELLGAQCSDLEKLLGLAREESFAAENGMFLRIWEIVSARAVIAERLETYHRQITELRTHLESEGEPMSNYDITNRVIELANMTLAQDQKTRHLLTGMRDDSRSSIHNLERSYQQSNKYLNEDRRGLTYACEF